MSTKGFAGFFKFCLDRKLLINIKKQVCRKQVFSIFANNRRSKQNKNNPAHPFVGIGNRKRLLSFIKKY